MREVDRTWGTGESVRFEAGRRLSGGNQSGLRADTLAPLIHPNLIDERRMQREAAI
jgi:hypothetical protein